LYCCIQCVSNHLAPVIDRARRTEIPPKIDDPAVLPKNSINLRDSELRIDYTLSLNVNLVRPNIWSVGARFLPTRPFRTGVAAQSKRANGIGSIRVARVGSFHQWWQTCRMFSRIARQIFINWDIGRRKSFDVNGGDFAYPDILHFVW